MRSALVPRFVVCRRNPVVVVPPLHMHAGHRQGAALTHACVPMDAYPCIHTHACVPMHAYLCMRTHACVPMHAYPCMRTHAYTGAAQGRDLQGDCAPRNQELGLQFDRACIVSLHSTHRARLEMIERQQHRKALAPLASPRPTSKIFAGSVLWDQQDRVRAKLVSTMSEK